MAEVPIPWEKEAVDFNAQRHKPLFNLPANLNFARKTISKNIFSELLAAFVFC